MERLRFKFRMRTVRTRAIKDFGYSFDILGTSVGPFVAGNHYELPFWMAIPFLKYKILELTDKIDIQEIQKWAYQESKSSELYRLDDLFFSRLLEQIEILTFQTEIGLATERELRQYVSNLQDLITVRHRKIAALSLLQRPSSKHLRALTEEEKILLKNITEGFRAWKNFYIGRRDG